MSFFSSFSSKSQLAALQKSCNQKDEEIKTLQDLLSEANDKLKKAEEASKAQYQQAAEEVRIGREGGWGHWVDLLL